MSLIETDSIASASAWISQELRRIGLILQSKPYIHVEWKFILGSEESLEDANIKWRLYTSFYDAVVEFKSNGKGEKQQYVNIEPDFLNGRKAAVQAFIDVLVSNLEDPYPFIPHFQAMGYDVKMPVGEKPSLDDPDEISF